jgi:hypothetical protein
MKRMQLASSLLTGCAAATVFLSPVVEQLVRMTPARLYFVKTLPERTDYLILCALILVIGLAAGFAEAKWSRAPVLVLSGFGLEHLIHGHFSRYAPLWNALARQIKLVGLIVSDGWFLIGVLAAALTMALLAYFPWLWNGFRQFLCGCALVVWGMIAVKIASPPTFFPAQANLPPRVPVTYTHPKPPIIWIVFDEWDYDLTFNRSDGETFPEMDRLRRQSLFFEHARAAGRVTLLAIPSLLTGMAVREYHAVNASNAKLSSGQNVASFPAGTGTIFDVAKSEGYHSSIVGWYHPYCRLFGAQVDTCYWEQASMPVLLPGADTADRVLAMLRETAEIEYASGIGPANSVRRHIARFRPMLRESQRASVRQGAAFSFLHLPVPHPPFFDADFRRVPASAQGYVQGLRMADRALGAIRHEMEGADVWEEALVIVTSDHPYRYQFLGGYGNGHIPLLIKFPHQTAAAAHTAEFEARDTRAIVEAAMRGQVLNADDGLALFRKEELSRTTPPAQNQ